MSSNSAQTAPDYFALAARFARQHAARLNGGPLMHWNVFDAPKSGGRQQSACGEYVPLQQFSTEPTCPGCRQQLALYESLEF